MKNKKKKITKNRSRNKRKTKSRSLKKKYKKKKPKKIKKRAKKQTKIKKKINQIYKARQEIKNIFQQLTLKKITNIVLKPLIKVYDDFIEKRKIIIMCQLSIFAMVSTPENTVIGNERNLRYLVCKFYLKLLTFFTKEKI